MKKRFEGKYKFFGILLLFVIGIIAITAAPIGTKPIPGHNGSQIQPGTILGDRMADNLNLTGNVSISDVLNVNGNMNITGTINGKIMTDLLNPVGTINMWAKTTAPAGWVLCDDASYSRTGIYAALYAILGITYGNVSATHFNVPNLKGNVPVGLNSADGNFSSLGQTGGEKMHTLSVVEMPSHTHTPPWDAIAWQAGALGFTSGGGNVIGATGNTGATGGSGAHNNLQPYITLNYIIKY